VGFLDDLRRQADALRDREDGDAAQLRRRVAATEQAARAAMAYFNGLADQLQVLHLPSPTRYELDRKHVFERLPMSDFFADGRRTMLGDDEVHESVMIHWQCKSGQVLQLVKDFPNEIERLEARLAQGAVPVSKDVVRHPDTGKLVEVRYEVEADFRASVRCLPQPAEARLDFVLSNLSALETITGWLPAEALDEACLDELAKLMVGKPSRFLDGLRELRRSMPEG
jgi:hypothetical protein